MFRLKELTVLLIISLGLMSCTKSDDDTIEENSKRISEMLFLDDDELQRKLEFEYDGDYLTKITHWMKTETSWKQDYLSEFGKTDEGFWHEYYYVKNGEYKYKRKNLYTVINDQLVEDLYYIGASNEWYLNAKWTYHYTQGKLSSYKIFRYIEGDWIERASSTFSYNDGKVQEHKYYEVHDNQNILIDRDTFYWEGEKMVQYIDYNREYGKMELNSKSNFTYVGDQVSEILLQSRRNDEWRFYKTTFYDYNSDGMLISQMDEWERWGNATMQLSYEDGKGNFGLIFYMPEEIAFNKPRFKDAEEFGNGEQEILDPPYLDQLLFRNATSGLGGSSMFQY